MKLNIQADLEIDDAKSMKIIEGFGSLDDLNGIIFEIFEARASGKLSSGIKYRLKFVEPTPYQLKLAATAADSE